MTSATTPRFHEKREAILDGAARQFNRHGIKGATLAEVAASVGLATNSITYYYRKKEDLASACLLRSMSVVQALAAEALAETGIAARVRRFISLYLQRLADIAEGRQPELAVFNDVRSMTPPHADAVFSAYIDMFRSVRRLLRNEATLPLSRDALNARAHLLLSIATWTRAWIQRYEPADYARVAGCIADVMVHGLGASGPGCWMADLPAGPPGPAEHTPLAQQAAAAAVDATPVTPDTPDTREAYLRAATRLINEHGYRGASVDRIAAALNLTKGSFYHHHETKDELVSACFERTFAAMRAVQTDASAWPGSGCQRLQRGCRALVRYQMSEHGPLLRVSASSALPEAMRRDKLRTMGRLGDRFVGPLVEGMADGSIRPLDQAVAAQLLSGMINAAAELERWVDTLPARSSADAPALPAAMAEAAAVRAADLYARPLFEGLLAPDSGPPVKATPAASTRPRTRQKVQA